MIEFILGVSATLVTGYALASASLWVKARKDEKKALVPSLQSILAEGRVVEDKVEAALGGVEKKLEEEVRYGSQYVKDSFENLKGKFISGTDVPDQTPATTAQTAPSSSSGSQAPGKV